MNRLLFVLFVLFVTDSFAGTIILHEKDAVVWHYEQSISGEISGFTAEEVVVHHNQNSFSVNVNNKQQFSFNLTLQNGKNKIWIAFTDVDSIIASDTLFYSLGYNPVPLLQPFSTVNGENVRLHAVVLENPYNEPLKYFWTADDENPAEVEIKNENDSVAIVRIPDASGDYYFNLLVVAGIDSAWYQTLVMKEDDKLKAFDFRSGYPQWMDDAVLYQITPYNFVANGTFSDITAKLPELKELGINTIWLQPISKSSYRGQGYDVINYFAVNPDLGTEAELHQLVMEAKNLGMRVLFDVVLNHTSIQHPYAKDVQKYGEESHYDAFYQHEDDGKPYSSFYNFDENGFVYYFWEDLVNLNYQNEDVQRWMLEVCKYWVRKFDIDGYRLDAIWGVNARKPDFARRLRTELKSIKPDILLLAEDKGTDPEVFELGFDAAYDWTTDTSWVSQWSWEYEYDEEESKTIFNYPEVEERGYMLKQALFQKGENEHRLLRYLENNDLNRFISFHGLKRTKMAAALLFALPGIPMLYNGQEIGFREHPYSTNAVFNRNWTIQAADKEGLFPYYQQLITLHKQYPSLNDTTMEEIQVSPEGGLLAFKRTQGDENILVIVNMDSASIDAVINLSNLNSSGSSTDSFIFKDLLSDNSYQTKTNAADMKIPMEGYGVRWLLLEEQGAPTGAEDGENRPGYFVYPNPSDGNFTIDLREGGLQHIRIINMRGSIIFEDTLAVPTSKKALNINLSSPVYFLEMSSRKNVYKTKLVIR